VPDLVIIGAGGFSTYALEVAEAVGTSVRMLVDSRVDGDAGSIRHGMLIRPWPDERELDGAKLFVAIGHNFLRAALTTRLQAEFPGVELATLVHPGATLSRTARVGPGSIVMAGAVIGRDAIIGRGVLVDAGVALSHDCCAGDFSSFASGVSTGGHVTVGSCSAIGLNASVRECVRIDSDSVVGAGSVVTRDIPRGVVAFGVPASIRRSRDSTEPYLESGYAN